MNKYIFDKTDKGREEIATRQYHLSTRLRALLVLIDGKQTTESLIKKVAGLGLTDNSFEELLDQGFIQGIATDLSQTLPNPPLLSSPLLGDRRGTGLPAADNQVLSPESSVIREQEHPLQSLHMFFSETIKNTLGLRGIKLQFKVSRASSLEEFRNLKAPYLEAIRAAKGDEVATGLESRLDQLITHAEEVLSEQTFSSKQDVA